MWFRAEEFVGTVTDLDTGCQVPHVSAVDTEAGLLEQFIVDGDGGVVRDAATKQPMRRMYRGRFSADLRPRSRVTASPLLGADACARCGGAMTLPGDDLCAVCRAREQGRVISVEPVDWAVDRACDNGCGRAATWQVADETAVTPVKGAYPTVDGGSAQVWFRRGALVGRRWYCPWCYRPPRVLDSCGEVIRENDEAGGCRPS